MKGEAWWGSDEDWFEATGNLRDKRPVHLARRHPRTDRIGCHGTPDENTYTACGQTWGADHVTLRARLVTCGACRYWATKNRHKFDDEGTYSRLLDGGKPFFEGEKP